MAENSKIEWTDATWNPITGCSVVSPGCTNCYAMKLAGTRLQHHPSRAGLTRDSKAGPVWTGDVRFNEEWLDQPLRWKRPRRIFVCAHGDLFHESVPDEWIDRVFGIMALAHWHTFQVLTKRADRMRAYLSADDASERILTSAYDALGRDCRPDGDNLATHLRNMCEASLEPLPMQNVWLGVSVEDQPRADERIPHLLATPAAVRFVSAEPLLGPVDLRKLDVPEYGYLDSLTPGYLADGRPPRAALDWVIAGGESGPGARPAHPDWFRSLRDQCAAGGVPFFFKQWGSLLPITWDGEEWLPDAVCAADGLNPLPSRFSERDIVSLGDQLFLPVGKKAAGRLLGGVEHNGMPGDAS